MTPIKRRLAVVTPWFGRELIGGAERLAWELARALARTGASVDVLTTTCRSFHDDWGANYHRTGITESDGLVVRRFNVDSRDRAAFTRASATLTSLPRISLHRDGEPIEERASRAFVTDSIRSKALLEYLRRSSSAYDAFFFAPYLYGPTIAGVPLVADRAFVVPCLHDEAYAYLNPVRDVFAAARGLLFNSEGEAEVAAAIYGPSIYAKSTVIGHAVEPVAPPRSMFSIKGFTPQRSRYILALGRQGSTKNTDFLLDAFARFRANRPTSLELVLAGPQPHSQRTGDGVVALGPVSEDAKASLLTHARVLAQPSINESFSRAIYESWYAQRPVIVHADCLATTRAVESCGGGWIASAADSWADVFRLIDESSDETVDAYGQRGFAAALENGTWDHVAARVLAAVDARYGRAGTGIKIDQHVPLGDRAATPYAAALNAALRSRGVDATVSIAESKTSRPQALSIAHVSHGEPPCVPGDVLIAHSGKAFVPEHPPAIFAANLPALQSFAERGISARLLPEAVDPGAWAGMRLAENPFADGRTTVLSIAPLGAADAERLIDMLVALIGMDTSARAIVDLDDCDDGARAVLEHDRRELDLTTALAFIGGDPTARFAALRAAHVACAIGGPLASVRSALDPLWFDIPVIAFPDPIVSEAIEPCGIVLDSRQPREIAAAIYFVSRDAGIRAAMQCEGRRVRARYAPSTIAEAVLFATGSADALRMAKAHDSSE